jgi:hypothetical protein
MGGPHAAAAPPAPTLRAPRWLPGGNAQTIWPALGSRQPPALAWRRERWDAPDGDFIDVDFVDEAPDAPLLVLFHGLEGSSKSHYATAFAQRAAALGWAYAVPLAAMVLSDVGIGLLMGQVGFGFHPMIPLVYGTFAFMVWAGGWLRENLSQLPGILARIAAIAGTAVLAEVVFFLVTNFGDWVFQPGVVPGGSPTYPHTPAGLAACYIAALPFFGKSLSGMAVYATLLFGGYELLAHRAFAPQPSVLVDARPTS